MDKSLKKLSRVELLELLVALSEEYDDLVDENDRLKKMLLAQRLPRSTKVGSIAEAALQVNGYFEAAQRSADDYLREIKHLRDELAARLEAPAGVASEAEIAAARQMERQVQGELKRSQDDLMQTKKELQRVRTELERMQGELEGARDRVSRITAQANSQADAILADAHLKAERMLSEASSRSMTAERKTDQGLVSESSAGQSRKNVFQRGRGHKSVADSGKSGADPSSTADIFGRARHSRVPAEGSAS